MNKKQNTIFMWVLGIIIIVSLSVTFIMYVLEERKLLPNDNITIVSGSHEGGDKYEKIDKVVVQTRGIAVVSYSFDGGINWQESNEYFANESENLVIVVKDINGKTSKPIEYKVSNVDSIPPVIKVSLPKTVLLNSKINMGEYVSVTDENSGVDGSISMTPSTLDTSVIGKKTITFSARDKAGNEAKIDVTIEIVHQQDYDNNSDTKVLYRYRVKNITEYDCNTHDCSYYESSNVIPLESMMQTRMCREKNQKVTFSNGCYIVPSGIETGTNCTQAITTVDRYSEYKADNGWTYVIDIYALGANGKQISLEGVSMEKGPNVYDEAKGVSSDSTGNVSNPAIDGYDAMINMLKSKYKYEPCGDSEISINGFCHAICSGRKPGNCEDGYTLIDGVCKKYVKKTCTDKCNKFTWSKWSEWSETPISSTDLVQVETKVVK